MHLLCGLRQRRQCGWWQYAAAVGAVSTKQMFEGSMLFVECVVPSRRTMQLSARPHRLCTYDAFASPCHERVEGITGASIKYFRGLWFCEPLLYEVWAGVHRLLVFFCSCKLRMARPYCIRNAQGPTQSLQCNACCKPDCEGFPSASMVDLGAT